jgi:dCTP deaminase
MPLADFQIRALCEGPAPMVAPFDPELLNPASLDVRLGPVILIESCEHDWVEYDMAALGHDCDTPYWLRPGQFILASTVEVFNMPDTVSAQFMLKSSRGREGLGSSKTEPESSRADGLNHLMAGFIDPGFNGSRLTLELHNVRQLANVPIWPSMRIGQIVCEPMEAPERSYRETGRYNGDLGVQVSRG